MVICQGCMEEKGVSKTCPSCGYIDGAGPESVLHLPPGTMLQGKYLLGRVLGQGGFGITYLAWDNILKLKLAIKEFLPQQLAYRTDTAMVVKIFNTSFAEEFNYGREKFLEEARTLARFNEHPNIVTVRDYFEANNTAYLVMNYHEGITLQSYLTSKGGIIPVEQSLPILIPVLDALKEVHASGMLHRDISPDNLLIDKKGRIVLIDFGSARQTIRETNMSLSVIMKAGYSPPEQYQSRGKQGPWTDIYAVAATIYRAITGQAPLEAIDRLSEDELKSPSQLKVEIDPSFEKTLLKALALKVENRYQSVEEFQAALFATDGYTKAIENNAGKNSVKMINGNTDDASQAEKPSDRLVNKYLSQQKKDLPINNKSIIKRKTVIRYLVFLIVICILTIAAISLVSNKNEPGNLTGSEEASLPQYLINAVLRTISVKEDDPTIANLNADYYIDYENGSIPIGDLPIGTRVVDPSWVWEFRTGYGYTGSGDIKPVVWILVARNHYKGLGSHVTLLTEDLIAKYNFDNSTNLDHKNAIYGSNHWGMSGTGDATRGLRPWLNSNGLHLDEGFYRVFSKNFKSAVLTTTLPNSEWKNGAYYSTRDYVFIPSTTELGDIAHNYTYRIGTVYAYFEGMGSEKRVALFDGNVRWYWTRSPSSNNSRFLLYVDRSGEFYIRTVEDGIFAVRPALNLKSETLVSAIEDK